MPKLSIISVNLNNKDGLKKTLESVFSQTFTDYEYIIIDGGSTDGSKELIEKYQNKLVYWVSEEDCGAYYAMNKGIGRTSGEFCMFLNSGDYLSNNEVLSDSIKSIEEKNADIYYGNIIIELEKGKPVTKKHAREITLEVLRKETINHQASFIRTTLFKELGSYDIGYSLAADHAFYVKAYLSGKSFAHIDSEMVCYQLDGISSLNWHEYLLQMKDIFKTVSQADTDTRMEKKPNGNLIKHKILMAPGKAKIKLRKIIALFK